MVHVETIDLGGRNVTLPNDRVGMVVVQPFLSLSPTEPYKCDAATKPGHLAVLSKGLEIARAAHHGAGKTHFTIFPEYSICGPDGVQLIESALGEPNWPTGTIVVGGTDAFSKPEFVELCRPGHNHIDTANNSLERIMDSAWVNCEITWVKAGDGTIERWLQPKLAPAWEEQAICYQHMFKGNSVFTFRGCFEDGSSYRFCSLVCFDWIASIDNKKVWQWVLEDLQRQASQTEGDFSLSWFFVIQNNKKPSHEAFLTEIRSFFDQTQLRRIRRDRACLVFANCAGKVNQGRAAEYGQTSLIFPPQSLFSTAPCAPTFSNSIPRFRSSNLLNGYHDVLFRERGACIHSFAQINPDSVKPGPAGRTIPVENAYVFPVNGALDHRAPSAPVPASIKWLNDELDELPGLSAGYPNLPLSAASDVTHAQTVAALRQITAQSAAHAIKLAAEQSEAKDADDWDETESQALEHLVHTLDIVSLGSPAPAVGTDSAHATFVLKDQPVDLVAIKGDSHEGCLEHARDVVPKPRSQILLVSRDRDNNRWLRKFGNFLQPKIIRLGDERNITDPASALLHIGYRNLLEVFQKTSTLKVVPRAIDAELAA